MHRLVVYGACAASVVLGLYFVFVRAPHPWGWAGFDDYYELGRTLARGEGFPTVDRPWGYAWYLAFFYRTFGDRPWIPLVVQVLLNAALPLLVYTFARTAFDGRVAAVAAALTGLFSFNTVYASTQSADSLCTVFFTAGIVLFARGRAHGDWRGYAAAGILLGLAAQFRPNVVLMPLVLGAFDLSRRRDHFRPRNAPTLLACACLVQLPWVVRNADLTGELIPASTHGGVQLWYGTLQTGPYLKSRAYNPRRVFEAGSFPYTSLDQVPLVVTARLAPCAKSAPSSVALVCWTDRRPQPVRVAAASPQPGLFRAEIGPSPAPTTYYLYFEALWPASTVTHAPPAGERSPYVYFVSADHLGDLDRHGDLLDAFDLVRLLRHVAWNEPTVMADRLDFDADGRLTGEDVRAAAATLLASTGRSLDEAQVVASTSAVTLRSGDGSTFTVPREWSQRITDLSVRGGSAEALLHATVPFAALRLPPAATRHHCVGIDDIAVNAVFYREQPHAMRRYLSLAFDNIRRNPGAYLAAVGYRAFRVFFIEGTDDPLTTHQFEGGGHIYRLAYVASVTMFALFLIGAWTAWRRGCAVGLPLLVIGYIPATLAFGLTNMRYSITVQPLLFVFVASAIVGVLERLGLSPADAREREQPI
jgi:Dolichyl-phosphate-mannose-protein mannosyltransferase